MPNPPMSLEANLPNLKDKKIFINENFEWDYPEGERITLGDLKMTVEEALFGILTDMTHEFPINQKFTHEHIISTGLGLSTELKYIK